MNENVIEWLRGQKVAAVTFTAGSKFAKKLLRLSKTHDEVQIKVNQDKSIFAHIPLSWIKVNPPKKVSEEQREAARLRLKKYQEEKRK